MLQAAVLDWFSFNPFSLLQDGLTTSKVDVGGCQVLQALVIAPVIVVLDEAADVVVEIARQIVVLKQDAVLKGLVPAFDLALRLRMIGCCAYRESNPGILVMETAKDRTAMNVPGPLDHARDRRILV